MANYSTLEEEKQQAQAAQTTAPVQTTPAVTPAPDYSDYNRQYNQAMERLEQIKASMPSYSASYDGALQSLFDEIMGYEKFSYSTADDMLYQNYKQQYSAAGRLAMEDSMGQAAALTGGYNSSYGQSLGQQQYGEYMRQLNDLVPELYGMAYQRHQGDLQALENRYATTSKLAEDEYRKYQDQLSAYYDELNYWKSTADTAYDRQQAAEEQAYQREQDAYQRQLQAYDRLANMILTLGYTPTAEELTAAGMSNGQLQAYRNAYIAAHTPVVYNRPKQKTKETEQSSPTITNKHTDKWVTVPGFGNLTYGVLNQGVLKGTILEGFSDDGKKVTYAKNPTWK